MNKEKTLLNVLYITCKDESEALYIGKALNLRKRLASYKRFRESEHSKTAVMLSKVQRIETILTTTEKEAIILFVMCARC